MTRKKPQHTKTSRYARHGAAIRRSRRHSAVRTRQRYDVLAMLKRVKFNALAKSGVLDGHPCVEITEEFVYSQR